MNRFEEVVRRMDISSISGDFVSPYTFQERDYFLCEYALADDKLLYTKGELAPAFGMEIPPRLDELASACAAWPITPEYRQPTEEFFAGLKEQAIQMNGAPSLFEMRVAADGAESWI